MSDAICGLCDLVMPRSQLRWHYDEHLATATPMTPPTNPVAALAEADHRVLCRENPCAAPTHHRHVAQLLYDHLPAGWTLTRSSERDALVAALDRSPYTAFRNCFWCDRHDYEIHADDCAWVKTRAALAADAPASEEATK